MPPESERVLEVWQFLSAHRQAGMGPMIASVSDIAAALDEFGVPRSRRPFYRRAITALEHEWLNGYAKHHNQDRGRRPEGS